MTMRTTVLSALVVIAASAGVAALTTSLIVDNRAPAASAPASTASTPARSAEESAALAEELRGLREENVALHQRLDDLEALIAQEMSRVPIEAVDATRKDGATPKEASQVAAILGDGGSGELPPAFVASVGQALKEIRDEEDRQREIKRAEERQARVEERVGELQEELGLSSYQTGELRVALTGLEEKREALRQQIDDGGGDRREMFEGFRTLYEETNAQLQTILSPEQFDQYQQSDRNRFGGFGRRGEGGPGGPPGGQTGGR